MSENEPIGSVPQSPLKPVENIPEETPVPYIAQDTPMPTVVIPPQTPPDIPRWFFVLLSITLLLFIGVIILLVLSFFQKKSSDAIVPDQQVSSVKITPTPTENPRSKSDELDNIEADITLIDFSELGEKMTELENQATVSASL